MSEEIKSKKSGAIRPKRISKEERAALKKDAKPRTKEFFDKLQANKSTRRKLDHIPIDKDELERRRAAAPPTSDVPPTDPPTPE